MTPYEKRREEILARFDEKFGSLLRKIDGIYATDQTGTLEKGIPRWIVTALDALAKEVAQVATTDNTVKQDAADPYQGAVNDGITIGVAECRMRLKNYGIEL